MKRAIISFISIILLISLASCSQPAYSDVKSATEVANEIASAITTENGTKVLDADAILKISDTELPYLKDFVMVKANDAKNVNEYGIFKVDADKTADMSSLLNVYVENLQKQYRAMQYLPAETEKVDHATVKIFGCYVVYSFLNERDTEALHKAIGDALTK